MSGVMTWLFASGHAADLFGVLAIEAAWLRFGRGWGFWGAMAGLLGPCGADRCWG